MRSRTVVLISALVPIALGLGPFLLNAASARDIPFLEAVALVAVNAIYMGIPHLLLGILALWRRGLRRHASPVLWCLTVYLVAFYAWVVTQYAPRDAAFIWLLYPPGSLVVLLVYWAVQRRAQP